MSTDCVYKYAVQSIPKHSFRPVFPPHKEFGDGYKEHHKFVKFPEKSSTLRAWKSPKVGFKR